MENTFKEAFCEFLFREEVLNFGDFIVKSGRKSPYFLNFGKINKNHSLIILANFFNKIIIHNNLEANCFYGPAYKGIPLALACAFNFPKKVSYVFNRKESKNYGDKGIFVGKNISAQDKVVILDDVITAGISIKESIQLIQTSGAEVTACIVAVDRKEKGLKKPASQEIAEEFKIPFYSLINIREIIKIAQKKSWLTDDRKFTILNYIKENES